METSVEIKSNIDGVITVNIAEADYIDELNKTFNSIRNQYTRPGFRDGKVPYSLIYKLYGYKTLCDCCVNKALNAVHDFINNDERLKELTMMQPLMKALSFPNKNEIDYRHPGDVSFSYVYASVPNIDINDVEEKCKKIEIENFTVGEIKEEDVSNVVERFKKKISQFTNVNKVTDGTNIVYFKNIEQKEFDENLFLPAQGCSIDGKPLDFMGLSINAEIELDIKDVLSLKIPWSYASYFEECMILTRLKEGKQKLVVTSIRSFEKTEITDEELIKQFSDESQTGELPFLKNIEDYRGSIKESLSLYMSCLFERIARTNIRENLINIYSDSIAISEEYLQCSGLNRFSSNELYKQFLTNNIKWSCIREALLKKYEISLTEEDYETMSDAYELSHNSDVKNLEKCIDYGSFLGMSDNLNKKDYMLDRKLMQLILSMCKTKEKKVNFSDFVQFLKVRILENLARYRSYESKK